MTIEEETEAPNGLMLGSRNGLHTEKSRHQVYTITEALPFPKPPQSISASPSHSPRPPPGSVQKEGVSEGRWEWRPAALPRDSFPG